MTLESVADITWVGGFYTGESRKFVWIQSDITIESPLWGPGEPHKLNPYRDELNPYRDEDCVAIESNVVIDFQCQVQLPFICSAVYQN